MTLEIQTHSVKIATFNMHGFHSNWEQAYLQYLCGFCDVVFVQEHWLCPAKLDYLYNVNSQFCCYAKSAMNDRSCDGILNKGRPFGGVAVLWKTEFSKYVSYCGSSDDGRIIYIKIVLGDCRLLLFGCYFPVYGHSATYLDEICDILGFIQSVINEHPECKVSLLGDFNFEFKPTDNAQNAGYAIFCDFVNEYNSLCTDVLESSGYGFTYHHATFDHHSWLDHVLLTAH